YEKEIRDLLGCDAPHHEDLNKWKKFSSEWIKSAGLFLKELESAIKRRSSNQKELERITRLESLIEKFEKIASLDNDAVCEMHESSRYGRSWSFDVIWPGKLSESKLFAGIKKVVIMSATLRPGDLAELGVSKEDYEFREWPRVFPVSRGPIYHYPATR